MNLGPSIPVSALAFSPDGKLLAVGGYQEVLLWDLAQGKLARRIGAGQLGDVVRAVVFRKDGKSLIVGEGTPRSTGSVKFFDVASGRLTATFSEPKDVVYAIAQSPDGKRLAAGGADRLVHVWDIDAKKLLATLQEHTDRVQAVAYSADGKFLATASADASARIWDAASFQPLGRLEQMEPVHGVAFSPDGQLLAVAVGGPTDRAIRLRKRENAELVRAIDLGTAMPLDVIWIPQGNRLFAPASDKTVKVYDAGNGGGLATYAGHEDWVYAVAISPDAARVASASGDGSVKLWNAADGALVATLRQLAPQTDEWVIALPQGYLVGGPPAAMQWKTANVKMPPDKIAALVQNVEIVKKALAGTKPAPPALQ